MKGEPEEGRERGRKRDRKEERKGGNVFQNKEFLNYCLKN